MGLLDGLLGQVLGGAMGPGRADDGGLPGMDGMGLPTRGSPGMGGLEEMMGGLGRGGASAGGGNPIIAILLQLLQQSGGLGGLLSRFQKAGYGEQANSWVAPGQNMPIDGNILSQVLGSGQLERIAEQLGMSRGQAADQVASALPEVVDHMTPQGSVPDNSDDLVNRALEILQRGGR